jgi:hypothetical protein
MRLTLYVHPFYSTNIFYEKYFHKCFSYFQNNNRDRRGTTLVSFLSLKIMGVLPTVYKSVCGYFLSKPHLTILKLSVQINKK